MQFLESGIDSLDSGIQDCLGFPYMERKILLFILYGSTALFEVQNNNFTITYINHIESKFIFFPFCIIALSFWLDLRFNQNSSVVIINPSEVKSFCFRAPRVYSMNMSFLPALSWKTKNIKVIPTERATKYDRKLISTPILCRPAPRTIPLQTP